MSERRKIPQTVANGIGFKYIDISRNIWTIKESECIIDRMKAKGMRTGKVTVESKTRDTSYRFDFSPSITSKELHSFRIESDDDGLYVTTDMGEKEWGGEEDEEEKKRLDMFFDALRSCTRSLGAKKFPSMAQVKAPAEEESKYGYSSKEDVELQNLMGKMKLGGRTRRQKNRHATKRRKTNLHNRRR